MAVAGWYPDPTNPAAPRWWDGTTWAPPAAPFPARPVWGTPATPDPQRDLDSELKMARVARIALQVGAGLYLAYFFVIALVAGKAIHEIRRFVDQIQADPDSNPTLFNGHSGYFVTGVATLEGFGVLLLVVQVIMMIWLFNAATFAYRAGIPARHSPIWAILGFIIPVVNLWFPYESAADLFPPGDRRRRLAAQWWFTFLLEGFLVGPIFVTAWFSTPAAIVVALICAAVPVLSARSGVALLAAAGDAHRAALRPSVRQ
jgi:Domain of unknown function (DUF4328)/Protein of unknown function (DUF2510)